jgi:F-type H+-transporting ATPase subunit epsilon
MSDGPTKEKHAPFRIEIVTPEKVAYQGLVRSVICPGTEGRFQVLHLHAPLLSSLQTGLLVATPEAGEELVFATTAGFAQVFQDHVLVLVETAERSEQIDKERALRSKERAEERLKLRGAEVDEARARASLVRAINRLKATERQ